MELDCIALASADTEIQALFAGSSETEGGWAWFRVLAQTTLPPGSEAILLVLRNETGAALAALPMVRMAEGGMRALTAPYSCLFDPPLGTESHAHALGMGLRRFIRRGVRLDCLDPENRTIQAFLAGLAASGLIVDTYRHFGNWYEGIDGFTRYWAGRGTRLRETVKRKYRRLDRDGRLSFACLQTPEEIEAGTTVYQAVYAQSWKVPEPDPDFIPAMLDQMAREGQVRLGILRVDGHPIAVQIWLVKQGRATIFKLAHLDAEAAHSPGTLLSWWLMSQLVDQENLREIDLGRGDDPYKREWLSERRDRIGIIACNPSSLLGLSDAARLILPARLKNAFGRVASGLNRR